ncbi:MAG TPA: hypothetical protein VME70_11175 [Mycobacteriales bacterium]|nr:hypothetical protein [Mycobacteriales bacterium]
MNRPGAPDDPSGEGPAALRAAPGAEDVVEQRFADYVREHWPALVDQVSAEYGDTTADRQRAERVLVRSLTRLGLRWRRVHDDPDSELHRLLLRDPAGRSDRQRTDPDGYLVMDVSPAGTDRDGVDAAGDPMSVDAALASIMRAVRRTRQRQGAAVAVVVVIAGAVIASSIGPGSARHGGGKAAAAVVLASAVHYPQGPTDFASDVTAGGGYIWTIETRPTRAGSLSYVVKRNPVNGQVVGRYRVPRPDDHIAYGFGKAWAWHDDNDYPSTAIATVDGAGGVDVERSTPSIAIDEVTFTDRFVWLTEPRANQVMTMRDGVLGAQAVSSVSGARFVVPLGPSSVLVAGRSGLMRELPSGNSVVIGGTPTLVAPAPSYGIWIVTGRRASYFPAISDRATLTLPLSLEVGAVIGDPSDGVYIATRSRNPRHYDPYLVYYSPAALEKHHPKPTARLDGFVQAETMTANPAGGIVFTTNEGAVDSWNPAGHPVSAGKAPNRVDHAALPSLPRRLPPRGGFA